MAALDSLGERLSGSHAENQLLFSTERFDPGYFACPQRRRWDEEVKGGLVLILLEKKIKILQKDAPAT